MLPVISAGAQAKEIPPFVASAAPVSLAGGFHEAERDELDVFHWMIRRGQLSFAAHHDERYLEMWVYSEFHDLSQELRVACGEGTGERFELLGGWGPLSVRIPGGADGAVLEVNKIFPAAYYRSDHRTLAIRVRPPVLHKDPERHATIQRQYGNAALNVSELRAGHTIMEATPTSLGIDLHGVCNVKPPCVYCEWDYSKHQEGDNVDVPFTRETLEAWGEFFQNSINLVNCSIGEPFMMQNFDELLDIFGNSGKVLEMTTNGQILTERNIQKLLGRRIYLYVSLDAATRQTYARLRNDKLENILHNLRRLIQAKGGPGQLPHLYLVFMPMRANVHELDAFIRLCADLAVDRLVLRPLNYSDNVDLDWHRAGYHFQYRKELLPFDELVRVSGRAAELCGRLGVPLSDQMDFGGTLQDLFSERFDEGRRAVVAAPSAAASVGPEAAQPVVSTEHGSRGRTLEAGGGPTGTAQAAPVSEALLAEEGLPSLGTEQAPACLEPWKSLYILRRGVFPCCYGGGPIAGMDEYRQAWNSPLMQAIRSELLRGRFHAYCLRSPACPIVRKLQHASALPFPQALRLRATHLYFSFDRITGQRLGKTYRGLRRIFRPIRWWAIRLGRAAIDPPYLVRHTKRLVRKYMSQSSAS